MVAAITLHLPRVVFHGAYGRPREINWLIGLALLVLTLLWDFSGYIYGSKKDAHYIQCRTCRGTREAKPETAEVRQPNELAIAGSG